MVLALSFFPVAYMNFKGMLESLDPSLDEAAAGLGAGKLRIFFSVTLPLLVPGFAGSFLLLFVEAIADLANPLVLGGDYTVLASRAYLAVTGEFNTSAGAAYSLTILLPALLVSSCSGTGSHARASPPSPASPQGARRRFRRPASGYPS